MSSFYFNQYIDKYNEFISQLKKMYHDNENVRNELVKIENMSDDIKYKKGKLFNKLINSKIRNQNLLLSKKIKMFSTKNNDSKKLSFSLFGNKISIKQILNKKSDDISVILWNYLHLLYVLTELQNENSNTKLISKLVTSMNYKTEENTQPENESLDVDETDDKSLEQENMCNLDETEKVKDEIIIEEIDNNTDKKMVKNKTLGIDVDSKTNNMLEDIVKSFDQHIDKSNPFQSIMDVTNEITKKYKDKIDNGEINLDGVFNDLQSKLPGLDVLNMLKGKEQKKKEKHIIDENFSTADVDVGKIDSDKGPNIGKMLNMFKDVDLNSMMNMKIPTNEQEAEELKNNMEKIMSSMNLDMDQLMKNFKQ